MVTKSVDGDRRRKPFEPSRDTLEALFNRMVDKSPQRVQEEHHKQRHFEHCCFFFGPGTQRLFEFF